MQRELVAQALTCSLSFEDVEQATELQADKFGQLDGSWNVGSLLATFGTSTFQPSATLFLQRTFSGRHFYSRVRLSTVSGKVHPPSFPV
jgi:hypothetical protein